MTQRMIVLAVLFTGAAALAEPMPRLAVLQLRASPNAASLSSAVGGIVANELQRLGVFEVTSADQVKDLLSLERQKELLGVEDDGGAMNRLGEMLNAQYLVTGEVSRLSNRDGAVVSLQLVLLDAKAGKRISSEVVSAKSEGELVTKVGPATVKLCGKALAGRQGTLYVSSSETGASVKVDDVLKGTTPLAGGMAVAAGPHVVTVEKEGFVAFQKEVRVRPDERTEEQAALVPSPDFIHQYEAHASRMRLGAYLATGVAVAGLASAGYFQVRAYRLYGAPDQAGTFAYHQSLLNQGIEQDETGDHRAQALRLKTQLQDLQRFTWIGAGAGAAAAVAATWLFVAGEPPGRYQKYVTVASVSLAPTAGGAFGQVALSF